MLVTLPEETPVNELVETAFSLEDRVGVSLGPVVVNGLYPEPAGHRRRPGRRPPRRPARRCAPGEADALAAAAAFRRHRTDAPGRAGRPAGRAAAAPPAPPPLPVPGRPRAGRARRARRPRCSTGSARSRTSSRARRRATDDRATCARRARGVERDHHLLRLGRRRQDDHRRGARACRRPASGRRAVVVTIDPAKRLADALGLEGLGNTPEPHRRATSTASCGR